MNKWFFILGILGNLQTSFSLAAESNLPATAPTVQPSVIEEPAVKPALLIQGVNDQSFIEHYPHLKKNTFAEPNSNFYLGFSMGVLGVVRNRMFFSANFFQIHYIRPYWDYEVMSISFGTTASSSSSLQSNHFIMRTTPKFRLTEKVSIGPLLGYEYVSFPKVSAVLYDGVYQTKTEPFSSKGIIYGAASSQNFTTDAGTKIKITEMIYNQTYSTEDAGRGWSYLFDSRDLRTDATPIKAGSMFIIEVGVIF